MVPYQHADYYLPKHMAGLNGLNRPGFNHPVKTGKPGFNRAVLTAQKCSKGGQNPNCNFKLIFCAFY